MAQQADVLKLAADNALQLARDVGKKTSTDLFNKIDDSIEKAKEHDDHVWHNPINKSNFNAARQIKQMWERTERFVEAMQVVPDHTELKDGAMKFIKEGKRLTHDRLKVLRYADREGWSAALYFVSDDIADDEKEEKRMKRGKKEADKQKLSKAAKKPRLYTDRGSAEGRSSYSTYAGASSASSGYQSGRRTKDNYSANARACFICDKLGHIAKYCPRRFANQQRSERF